MNKNEETLLAKMKEPLLHWFAENKRKLPWREGKDPYKIWVSEIMLQQTRVETVMSYYGRFLHVFPSIESLAKAPEEELLKHWEGLGYYSRARNLKKAAMEIAERFGGEFPRTFKDIKSLPGIGEYTAGAIASIAFQQPVPAVDGNVLRVLTRFLDRKDDVLKEETKALYRKALMPLLQTQAGEVNEALMELGEVVCLPKPKPFCERCPLAAFCLACTHQTVSTLPVRIPKTKRKTEKKTVILVIKNGKVVIRRRQQSGLLAGMYEFPSREGHLSEEDVRATVKKLGFSAKKILLLPKAKHIFTHITWEMTGYAVEAMEAKNEKTASGGERKQKEKGRALIDSCSREGLFFADTEELQKTYAIPSAFKPYLRWFYEEGINNNPPPGA